MIAFVTKTRAALLCVTFAVATPAGATICNYIGPSSRMSVNHTTSAGTLDSYVIQYPDTRHSQMLILSREIPLKGGDRVKISACGCTQTGGSGKTWKDFVNPQGPKSNQYYAGTIGFKAGGGLTPLLGMQRLSVFMRQYPNGYLIPRNANRPILLIGFQDDDYNDNGYWGHDDGTGGQCRTMGAAEIRVTVTHGN